VTSQPFRETHFAATGLGTPAHVTQSVRYLIHNDRFVSCRGNIVLQQSMFWLWLLIGQAMVRLAAAAERKCPAQLSKSNGNGGSPMFRLFRAPCCFPSFEYGTSMLLTIFRVCSAEKAKCVQGEDEEDALDFSALQVVRPMIERVPVEQAPEAYAKMMRNESRLRMVAVRYISPHSSTASFSSNGMRA
jgi:hypothetical protein